VPIYNQAVKRRQLAGRFAECLDGITTQLGAAGYSGQVVSQYECALVHLALWCKRRSILPAAFNDAAVARFVQHARTMQLPADGSRSPTARGTGCAGRACRAGSPPIPPFD